MTNDSYNKRYFGLPFLVLSSIISNPSHQLHQGVTLLISECYKHFVIIQQEHVNESQTEVTML